MHIDDSPTQQFYEFLIKSFEQFNVKLFDGQLPSCLITVQRKRNTMGHFSPERWGNQDGQTVHEIALNPSYFATHRLIEIFQTLVHEQCHLWQYTFGKKKSRASYHNKEWAEKMESVGLMPSETGMLGGKRTGQRMADYPVSGGKFLSAAEELVLNGENMHWFDMHPASSVSTQMRNAKLEFGKQSPLLLERIVSELIPGIHYPESLFSDRHKKRKVKYVCSSGCGSTVWGKPGMKMICDLEGCNHSLYREVR